MKRTQAVLLAAVASASLGWTGAALAQARPIAPPTVAPHLEVDTVKLLTEVNALKSQVQALEAQSQQDRARTKALEAALATLQASYAKHYHAIGGLYEDDKQCASLDNKAKMCVAKIISKGDYSGATSGPK